ncbi:MAG: MBL fold metallo-hydrolase [Spirochaetales bacterium]|nr:MBL fold metallo-hydrolase [Spirochaetales bacterium]
MIERIIVGIFRTNCYLFAVNKKECIIIDPGGDAEKIISQIELLNMTPTGIVFTHGHFDHTMATGSIIEYFQKKDIVIKCAIHREDKEYLGKTADKMNKKHLKHLGPEAVMLYRRYAVTLPGVDIELNSRKKVFNTKLSVIETPGHSKGSICLYNEQDGIIFTGDTLFFDGIGRSDLPGGDEKLLLTSIKNKILTLPPETSVFPGHGPLTTIEREIKGNPFLLS